MLVLIKRFHCSNDGTISHLFNITNYGACRLFKEEAQDLERKLKASTEENARVLRLVVCASNVS